MEPTFNKNHQYDTKLHLMAEVPVVELWGMRSTLHCHYSQILTDP